MEKLFYESLNSGLRINCMELKIFGQFSSNCKNMRNSFRVTIISSAFFSHCIVVLFYSIHSIWSRSVVSPVLHMHHFTSIHITTHNCF